MIAHAKASPAELRTPGTAPGRALSAKISRRGGTLVLSILCAVIATGLMLAPSASAEMGITGWYDFPIFPEPNEFSSPRDAVVNGSGAGDADPGDFYVADQGSFSGEIGSSINQYSVTGERIRKIGEDVVASGPGSSNERQSVAIFAEGGTFTLTFGGETTSPLAFNAAPEAVEAALNTLASIGGVGGAVDVTGGPGSADGSSPYLITFSGAQGGASQPLVTVGDGDLTGPGATSFVASPNKGGTGKEICEEDRGDVCKKGTTNYTQIAISEVTGDIFALGNSRIERYSADGEYQRAFGFDVTKFGPNDGDTDEVDTLTVKATGGTFTVSSFYGGTGQKVSAPIPFDATPAELADAINAMPNVGTESGGSVDVTGGPGDATGSSPYVITFAGVNAGDSIGNFEANATNLVGAGKEATVVTTIPGGEAEICTLADVCGNAFSQSSKAGAFQSFRSSMAVAPSTAPNAGNLLISENKARVQEFDGEGNFLRMFGWDVIDDGPNQNREPQSITVAANGGTYTATFEGQTTSPIAFNASAATLETELNALSTIGGPGATASVSGGPGDNNGRWPYVVVLGGSLAGTNPPFMTTDTSLLTGGGFQGPRASVGGGFSVCVAAEECRAGVQGAGLGQFSQHIEGVAVDSSGAIYTSDGRYGGSGSDRVNYRVQKFVPSGSGLTPEFFGKDEVQSVTVKATAGSFRLGMIDSYGARGRGSFGSQQMTINNVTFEAGTFQVGMPVDGNSGGNTGSRVAGVSGNTVELTRPINLNCGNCEFTAPEIEYTADLPAGASAAEVEAALNELGPVKDKGGSVTVSGGPGDETGSAPYVVSFDGGTIARTSQPQLFGAQGTTPLSGGTGAGANEAAPETDTNGGPNGQNKGITEGNTADSDSVAPLSLDVGPTGNVVIARNVPPAWDKCEDGGFAFKEVRVEEFSGSGDFLGISKPCTGLRQPQGGNSAIPQISFNQATGDAYMWQTEDAPFKEDGTCCENRNRFYLLGDAGQRPTLVVNTPSNLSPTGATISGTINPNGPGPVNAQKVADTTYRVEYKKPSESNWEVYAPDVSVGGGTGPVSFNVGISGLTPKATYEARVVVKKPFGFVDVIGISDQFTTLAAAPTINAVTADHISASSADLHAVINPLGTDTTYHFEYGPTPEYGLSTPETPIGDSLSPIEVEDRLTGLEPVLYYFRVVATNALGTVFSTGQTFNFYPEPCPNATVRQQTGASSLPDCRAYELVSAADAGSSTLLPGGPSSDTATGPSRFSYYGLLGSIPGPWNPPNTGGDLYVATRTDSGWRTNFVGIPGDQSGGTTGPPNGEGNPTGGEGSTTVRGAVMADTNLSRYIGWNPGHQGFTCCGLAGSMAPFVFDAQGNDLGRWPTNAGEIPDSLKDIGCWTNRPDPPCGPTGGYGGDVRPAADFRHYFFSSGNMAFAPEGQVGGMGSAYDNDIEADTVTVVSKRGDGTPIPKEPGVVNDDYLALPAAAEDGSRILMAASGTGICGESACDPMPFPCGIGGGGFDHGLSIVACPPLPPSHLYMRVGNAITYDVSQGNLVDFEGVTDDASKVFFSSGESLIAADEDTSRDLYMWNEATDDLTVIADGGGSIGNTDACNASWVTKCGIEIATPPQASGGLGENAVQVNTVIDNSGDVYFYSPEQFVGSNGIPGRRNFYIRHGDGEIQYIATMDADKPATRIEVGANGRFAAFLTTSRVTSFDNNGFAQMYRFDTESGDLRCVSCPPSGAAPTSDVEGSQNGTYLSTDGRTFFATADQLVPQDTNGLTDVYEYVSGRPQLISTGIGQRDATEFGKTGLIGVSADGVDVFFSTFETLVEADRNGSFLKFYNARTNGGFATANASAPCAAADECHGVGNPGSAMPMIGSTANLGGNGNLTAKKSKKKKRSKKHRRKGKRAKNRKSKKGKKSKNRKSKKGKGGNAKRRANRGRGGRR